MENGAHPKQFRISFSFFDHLIKKMGKKTQKSDKRNATKTVSS
jgi:hypothetical protein